MGTVKRVHPTVGFFVLGVKRLYYCSFHRGAVTKFRCLCASRNAASTSAGFFAFAKINPR